MLLVQCVVSYCFMHDVDNLAQVNLKLIIRNRITTAQRFLALLLRMLVSL